MRESRLDRFDNHPPILGICAWSGTGKTTLLRAVIPMLRERGLRLALLKHAHHRFDIDHPGKDSHTLREAGAEQVVVASRERIATIRERNPADGEPSLQESLAALDSRELDLVLVEGFKHAAIAKLELHRPALGKTLLCSEDRNVVAVASDVPLPLPRELPQLDLNSPAQIAEFICEWHTEKRRERGEASRRKAHA